MKIQSFRFKNACSYGNVIQSIEFSEQPRLILIKGKNGHGKSTIKDTLDFAIYGNCVKRKNKSIANRVNKHLFTQVDFKVNSSDVRVERGVEPNLKKLYINNEEQEEVSSKNEFDKNIEELIGIPFNIYANTISISIEQFKSFISLKAEEKRKIIDKIFNLDIYNEVNSKIKEDISAKKNESDSYQKAIDNNEEILKTSKAQLESLKQEVSEQVDEEIAQNKNKINNELTPQLNSIKEKIKEVDSTINDIRDNKIKKIERKKQDLKSKISTNKSHLKILEGDSCPYCHSDLNDEKHKNMKSELENENKDHESKIQKIDEKIEELSNEIQSYKKQYNGLNDEKSKIDASIASLNSNIESLNNKKKDDTQINKLSKTVKDIEEKQESLKYTKGNIDNEIATLKELSKILIDEKGVKGAIMDQIVPTLNERIKYYSHYLESEFKVEFDKHFNASISVYNEQVDIESLSTGELKKINLISALSILETIMMQHNLNVLFLDELFSSLDPDNVDKIVNILRELVEKYNLNILTISHMDPSTDQFDQIYQVERDEQGFSSMYPLIK
jgi:DNA repair exonuclease SbcCD ATPase subunit